MDEVNGYVQSRQNEIEERFEGTWLLATHWDHVHPSPHGERNTAEIERLIGNSNIQMVIATTVGL